jgi:hypothetical protein
MMWPLLCLLVSLAAAQFTNPAQFDRETWYIGDTQRIEFDTDFDTYTVAIWQQSKSQQAALLGPILYQPSSGVRATEFDWVVQAYDFDLDVSDNFFLWLFEGPASVQGNQSAKSLSSSFFTIKEARVSTTTETTSFVSSTTQPATISSSTTLTPAETPSTTGTTQASTSDNGLSAAAQGGIGAGVGVVGLACIIALLIWWRHLKSKREHARNVYEQSVVRNDQSMMAKHHVYSMDQTQELPEQMPRDTATPAELWAGSRS